MAEETPTFSPSETEVNRGREQGLGMGQRELEAQHDPDGDTEIVEEEDLARPESHKVSQGLKTRQHSKDIISRRV